MSQPARGMMISLGSGMQGLSIAIARTTPGQPVASNNDRMKSMIPDSMECSTNGPSRRSRRTGHVVATMGQRDQPAIVRASGEGNQEGRAARLRRHVIQRVPCYISQEI